MPVLPQLATGNMEAARDTLTRNLQPAQGDLTKLVQSLMLKEALSRPFPETYTPEWMPLQPEPVDMIGPTPVPLLEMPPPELLPIEEGMHPSHSLLDYSRIGFPEAVNPRTFASRLSQNYEPNPAALQQFEGKLPPIDPAQDMVDQVISNPEGEP
jgi:hypothetical protein